MEVITVIKLFTFQDVELRTTTINNEPYFVGKDVTEILGYMNHSKALRDHVDDEDKLNNESLSSLGQRGGWLINESGLYSLILKSKLPKARVFKRWVTSEVLPAIRQHGGYLTPDKVEEALLNPDTLIRLATSLKEERELRQIAEHRVAEFEPKVDYYDKILSSTDTVTTTQIAADYGISAQNLNSLLCDLGVQRKVGGQWILYKTHMNKGYTKSHTISIEQRNGVSKDIMHTKWTQKGRLFMYELLKSDGVTPNTDY